MENNDSTKAEVTSDNFCVDCKELIGKGRHTPPHNNLIQTDFKEIKSMFGGANEYYYKCKACSATWMHETGSSGAGWM